MPRRLSPDRVVEAAQALGECRLGRSDSTLIRWMLLKSVGGGAETIAEVAAETARTFTDAFFEVPGNGSYRWFNPFQSQWMSAAKGNWAIQTIWTQLDRPNQTEKLMYVNTETVAGDEDGRTVRVRRVEFADPERYHQVMSDRVMRGRTIPIGELAVWRNRFAPIDDDGDVATLAGELVRELNLTVDELHIVFGTDTDLEDHTAAA